MKTLRVLVADDSAVMRKLVTEVVRAIPGMTVAAAVRNGEEALAWIDTEVPDAVILDIEMPVMDGLTTLGKIRERFPKLPVIMFSTLAQHGAKATVEALSLGASDYVAKPTGGLNVGETVTALRDRVAPILGALCQEERRTTALPRSSALSVVESCDLVVVAASTGGPVALGRLLSAIDDAFPVPIIVVQHMPATFTRHLAVQLDERIALTVREIDEKSSPLGPGVWVAPGGRHLTVKRQDGVRCAFDDGAPVNSVRPAADVLFRSAAVEFGARLLGIVLTGMGHDGQEGCARIRDGGGHVWVQDAESSVVWGMPGAVARAGWAEVMATPEELGEGLHSIDAAKGPSAASEG